MKKFGNTLIPGKKMFYSHSLILSKDSTFFIKNYKNIKWIMNSKLFWGDESKIGCFGLIENKK